MITKDSFSITISKFSLVYQVVLVLLIAALIFGIIGYAILAPTLSGYVKDLKELNISGVLKDYLKSLFSGDTIQQEGMNEYYQQLVSTIKQIGVVTKDHVGSIWGGIIAIIVLSCFSAYSIICAYIPSLTRCTRLCRRTANTAFYPTLSPISQRRSSFLWRMSACR